MGLATCKASAERSLLIWINITALNWKGRDQSCASKQAVCVEQSEMRQDRLSFQVQYQKFMYYVKDCV